MYRFVLSVTMVVSLAAASGCGAHSARHSATGSNVADVSKDPSWCPPGEEFSFGGARESASVKHEASTEVEIKPNAAKRPTAGAVHAAVY